MEELFRKKEYGDSRNFYISYLLLLFMKRGIVFLFLIIMNVNLVFAYEIQCNGDSDCRLDIPIILERCIDCDAYGCRIFSASDPRVVAVNFSWTPECKSLRENCGFCEGGIDTKGYIAKCLGGKCIKILDNRSQEQLDKPEEPEESDSSKGIFFLYGFITLLLVFISVILFFIFNRRRKKNKDLL
jgi:hypothetical protein